MKRILYLFFNLIVFFMVLQGCSAADAYIGPKSEVKAYDEKTIKIERNLVLDIDCDFADIEFYSWDKGGIKLETTKRIRGTGSKDKLVKELDNITVTIKQDESKITIKSRYQGFIKSPADKGIYLRAYIPRKVDSIRYRIDTGSVKFFDDIACNELSAEVNAVNTEIRKFTGKINLTGDMANLRIENGILNSNSSIKLNIGNIYVNASYEEGGRYSFETGMGIVEISAPASARVTFETAGIVDINEFSSASFPTVVSVKNDMGKITIKKAS